MKRETKTVQATVVNTQSGAIQGEKVNGVLRFLGIPYAQGISGKNRFAPPQPVVPWKDTLQAIRYAQSSPQQAADPTGGSPVTPAFDPPEYVKPGDSCLALNVWTTPQKTKRSLSVMVWLHGGGWTSGSGSCAIYDGANLALRGDVIVVTINHRLGASGFTDFSRVLGGEFAHSSNLGIKDIVAALQWVHNNIAAFGGNPELVTIFGESGGGWKVATMLGVPEAKGLFQRAIIESGPLTRFLTHEQADKIATDMLTALGIDKAHPEALYKLSSGDVEKAERTVMSKMPMSFKAPGFPTGFWPVLDEEMLPEHVFDSGTAKSSLQVPLLVGQNGTEFTLFMLRDKAAYSLDEESLQQRVAGTFGKDAANKILPVYKKDFPGYDASGLWFRIFSDYAMGTLSSAILDVRSVKGAAPVYAYRFDWQTPIYDGKLYSPHTIEIPFVFNNVTTQAGITMTGGSTAAAELAKTVSDAWVTFARTGKPAAKGLPEWKPYTEGNRESMHINTTSHIAPYMEPEMVQLFHEILWKNAGLKP
ncbi:MAG TPA: carboxylesterase family protein [Chitinophagaceae bacterium]|nr:carboxylesterase family protein [Chitinophagaceae bacterium]